MTRMRPGVVSSGGAGVPAAAFVAVAAYQFAAGNQDFSFAGMLAGDLAIVYCQGTTTFPLTPSGWTFVANDAWNSLPAGVFYKVLSAGDITAGKQNFSPVDAAACGLIVAYRGPTVATYKTGTTSAAGANNLVQTGFAKAAGCKGIVTVVLDRDEPSPFVAPGLVNTRINAVAETNFAFGLYDILTVASYADNSTLTFTGFTTGNPQHGALLELT